ncbi:MAG: class I SAM-dependent methyltransferase [Micromonosporaceae bacterium]|nr:class I SAM-dependent methyltransferase [Micromonosporaceae bacterium]
MQKGRASRTAVLVCQGRAAAQGRLATGTFSDPVAMALLHEHEQVPVRQVREGTAPSGWRQRMAFESVRACSEVVVPRTIAIDAALRERLASQVVILGAGLDARAWRMPEMSTVDVFEVDHPASQADKRSRVAELTPTARSVRFVPVDLSRDPLDDALREAGHRADRPTTWIWEGVIPYLRSADVVVALRTISVLSAAGSRLIANYQSPSALARVGRFIARAMAGGYSALAGEPWRSLWRPSEIDRLFRTHEFVIATDVALAEVARDIGMAIHQARSLTTGRVAVADRS